MSDIGRDPPKPVDNPDTDAGPAATSRPAAGAIAERKRALRAGALARRAAMTDAQRSTAGEGIARAAVRLATELAATTVAAYAAVQTEPPTAAALEELARRGVGILLPAVSGRDLEWAVYDGTLSLGEPYGLLEPPRPFTAGSLDRADLVLAPALLVDRLGHRLGRGGGYYDRALADSEAPVYAVVYEEEVVDSLPAEAHDVTVTGAITPSGSITFAI